MEHADQLPLVAPALFKCILWLGRRQVNTEDAKSDACLCCQSCFLCVFSEHGFAEIKECKLQRKQKLGVVCHHVRRYFLILGVLLVVLFVCCLCFCFFGGESPKKAISCSLRGFSSFVPPKALSLKSFSSSCSVFNPCFPLHSLSKFHIFLCFLSKLLGGFFSRSCFAFPLLMLACFFETNFLNIPFSKPTYFHFWLFFFVFCCSVLYS